MCFIISLWPATIALIFSYFVLLTALKSDRRCIRAFGKILATWLGIVAILFLIGGAYLHNTQQCPVPHGEMHQRGHMPM